LTFLDDNYEDVDDEEDTYTEEFKDGRSTITDFKSQYTDKNRLVQSFRQEKKTTVSSILGSVSNLVHAMVLFPLS